MSARTLRLGQVVDPAATRVEARLDPAGRLAEVVFDLGALPRVEPLLRGRPVADVPRLVERVCGICPAAHHLAGIRALEALLGVSGMPATADAVRRLLHHGAVLQAHAERLVEVDADRAVALRGFGTRVLAAAGGSGHFPRCAVPGGVVAPVDAGTRDALVLGLDAARAAASELVELALRRPGPATDDGYDGHDVALVDAEGLLDLCGERLRARAASGAVDVSDRTAPEWADAVAETRPARGGYRVGPVAQLRAPDGLPAPDAEAARLRWLASGATPGGARAVAALHAVEAVGDLLDRPELVAGASAVAPGALAEGAGTGWVDGARGLLVHHYVAGADGLLAQARITTPTSQNERWLSALLTRILGPVDVRRQPPPETGSAIEAAIRAADPCLPCTALPPGSLAVTLDVVDADRRPLASWRLGGAGTDGAGSGSGEG
ncbi:Ni/Fe hydrogenase subunit alpha [Nocardioides hungaricus]